MLATLALMMALMYSNDVSQRRIDFDRDNLSMEVEEMATAVALETLARIREMPYDGGLKPLEQYKGADGRLLAGLTDQSILSDLAPLVKGGKKCKEKKAKGGKEEKKGKGNAFGHGKKEAGDTWSSACATMNDFNGMETALVAYPLAGGEVDFGVEVDITYVESIGGAMVPVTAPKLQKQVTVEVTDVWSGGARTGVFLPTPIRISRVFSLEV